MKQCESAGGWRLSHVTVLPAAVLVLLTACASTRGISNFYLNPADEGSRAFFDHEGLTISCRYLDENQRTRFLKASGQEALARETGKLPLSAFLIEIANQSPAELVVEPASTRFVTGFGPVLSPVSYVHIYMNLPGEEGRQVVLREFQRIVFDRPVTVPPGGQKEGLLFFRRPEKVSEDVAVVLSGLYLGGAHMNAVLSFKAIPLAE